MSLVQICVLLLTPTCFFLALLHLIVDSIQKTSPATEELTGVEKFQPKECALPIS